MPGMLIPHPRSGLAFKGLRIGLLGGSFNPAHAAHLQMSLYALKRLKLDQIWWLVSPQNPLKPAAGMAPLPQRIKSAQELTRHPRIRVLDIESALGTRYTVDTIRALRRHFPRTHFVWLMGADNLQQIPLWKDWTEIFRLVPVAVFRRPAYAARKGFGKAGMRFAHAFRGAGAAGKLAETKAPAWLVLDNRLNPLSGTALRNSNGL